MTKKKTLIPLALLAVAALGFVAWWQYSSESLAGQELPLLTESQAVSRAIGEANFYGLKGTPSTVTAKLTTLGEYADLTGFTLGSDAAKVGLSPDLEVWVVTLTGRVEWSGPGRPGAQSREVFDNITVEIDARTGEIKGTAAYRAGYTPPLLKESSLQ